LGTCIERLNRATNTMVKFALVANPSHLEGLILFCVNFDD